VGLPCCICGPFAPYSYSISSHLRSATRIIQWTFSLLQISDIVVGQEPNVSAKDYLLRWAKRTTNKYPGVNVVDFTKSWRDGLAFSAIIHRNRPDLIDWRSVKSQRASERMESAFYIAEREYGVTRLLDPEGGCWGWVAACPTRLLNLLLLTEQ
jgi:hypothetical protein